MPRPEPLYPDRVIILAPEYLSGAEYYATMMAYPQAVIDTSMRFDKRRKQMHRCEIADTHGRLTLTVPIEKPRSMTSALWSDITVSGHDRWWTKHLEALRSAYGRTPFFEYYIDSFMPFFSRSAEGMKLMDMNMRLDELVRQILCIDTAVTCSMENIRFNGHTDDFRSIPIQTPASRPYYQIWSRKYGFMANLSILDLIFNMGPEAPLVLRSMLKP